MESYYTFPDSAPLIIKDDEEEDCMLDDKAQKEYGSPQEGSGILFRKARKFMRDLFDRDQVMDARNENGERFLFCNVCQIKLEGPLRQQIPSHLETRAHEQMSSLAGVKYLKAPFHLDYFDLGALHPQCASILKEPKGGPRRNPQRGAFPPPGMRIPKHRKEPPVEEPLPLFIVNEFGEEVQMAAANETAVRPWPRPKPLPFKQPLKSHLKRLQNKNRIRSKAEQRHVDRRKFAEQKRKNKSMKFDVNTIVHPNYDQKNHGGTIYTFPSELAPELQKRINEKSLYSGTCNIDYRCLEIITEGDQSRLYCALCKCSIHHKKFIHHVGTKRHKLKWLTLEIDTEDMVHVHRRMLKTRSRRLPLEETPSPLKPEDPNFTIVGISKVHALAKKKRCSSATKYFFEVCRSLHDTFKEVLDSDLLNTVTAIEEQLLVLLKKRKIVVKEEYVKEIMSLREYFSKPPYVLMSNKKKKKTEVSNSKSSNEQEAVAVESTSGALTMEAVDEQEVVVVESTSTASTALPMETVDEQEAVVEITSDALPMEAVDEQEVVVVESTSGASPTETFDEQEVVENTRGSSPIEAVTEQEFVRVESTSSASQMETASEQEVIAGEITSSASQMENVTAQGVVAVESTSGASLNETCNESEVTVAENTSLLKFSKKIDSVELETTVGEHEPRSSTQRVDSFRSQSEECEQLIEDPNDSSFEGCPTETLARLLEGEIDTNESTS